MASESSIPIPLDPVVEDVQDRRLWIGNLDSRITEFVLLKLLQQHGSIEKFDLLFHRSGPLEGQPRGYAFVTYSNAECAKEAKKKLDGKVVGNKTMSVKWAHNWVNDSFLPKHKVVPNIPALAGAKNETKISKVCTIQAIEAKLKTMEATSASLEFEINKKPSTSTANVVKSSLIHPKHNQFSKHKSKPYFKTKNKK